MLRNTFENVIEMVREEARLSTNTSRGTDHLEHIKRLIKRHYETLADEWDWRHLELRGDEGTVNIEAGSRHYNFPAAVNIYKIDRLVHKWASDWDALSPGITNDHYSIYDSEEDERNDPIQAWDFKDEVQFEVWPLPASASGPVRFEGQKKVEQLVDKNSRLDIDDVLVSLRVAAEILGENERKAAASIKATAAAQRLIQCKGYLSSKERFVIGMGGRAGDHSMRARSPRLYPRHPQYIRSGG